MVSLMWYGNSVLSCIVLNIQMDILHFNHLFGSKLKPFGDKKHIYPAHNVIRDIDRLHAHSPSCFLSDGASYTVSAWEFTVIIIKH
jgi:hypothetical protein